MRTPVDSRRVAERVCEVFNIDPFDDRVDMERATSEGFSPERLTY